MDSTKKRNKVLEIINSKLNKVEEIIKRKKKEKEIFERIQID